MCAYRATRDSTAVLSLISVIQTLVSTAPRAKTRVLTVTTAHVSQVLLAQIVRSDKIRVIHCLVKTAEHAYSRL